MQQSGTKVQIRAVIFDYGEVLSLPPLLTAMDHMSETAGMPTVEFERLYWHFRNDYDRGTLDGKGYWTAIGQAAGRSFSEEQAKILREQDIAAWSRLNVPMVRWAQELQKMGVRTAILSNMHQDLLAEMRQRFRWLDGFLHHTFSCEVGCIKPEEAIYDHCVRGLGSAPEETLFIDDRVSNIEAARRFGLRGIVFASAEQTWREIEERYVIVPPSPLLAATTGAA